MSATATFHQVRRDLGPDWERLPCVAREAVRGVAALLFRAGDGVRFHLPAGEGCAELSIRVARMAQADGPELAREIGQGLDLLLERGIVAVSPGGAVSFGTRPSGRARPALGIERAVAGAGTAKGPGAGRGARP